MKCSINHEKECNRLKCTEECIAIQRLAVADRKRKRLRRQVEAYKKGLI